MHTTICKTTRRVSSSSSSSSSRHRALNRALNARARRLELLVLALHDEQQQLIGKLAFVMAHLATVASTVPVLQN